MNRLILFNKPYRVMCQFTDEEGRATLVDYIPIKDVYAAGRLDFDSEGLLVLTNVGWLQHLIANPSHGFAKTYLTQVEGIPSKQAIEALERGVMLKDGITRPAAVEVIESPEIWERVPPIRYRKSVPTSWLRITMTEGRNRQVRRMTAAVGNPTLRLIRERIGPWKLLELQPGQWREVECPRNRREIFEM